MSIRRPPARRKGSRPVKWIKPTYLVDLIDAAFNKRLTVIENGKPKRITVFAAIFRQLWVKEMGGNRQALRVRRQYELFAHKQLSGHEREIIVKGGLPRYKYGPGGERV